MRECSLVQLLPPGVFPLDCLSSLCSLLAHIPSVCPHCSGSMSLPRGRCLYPGKSCCPNQVIITGETQGRRLLLEIPMEVFSYARGINSKEGRGSPSLGLLRNQGYYQKSGHFWPQKSLLFHSHFSWDLMLQNPQDSGILSYLKLVSVTGDQKELIRVTIGPFDIIGS